MVGSTWFRRRLALILALACISFGTNGQTLSSYTGLPVVYIDTEDGKALESRDEWKDATIRIEYDGSSGGMEATPIKVRGHGNSTWGWPKKPYAIKFKDGTPVLGMPEGKRWLLIANFMDRTLMRNAIAYDCGQATSLDWTPHYRFCEVVFNGRHQGNYMLTEQVRVAKNRVDLSENGYLMELDFHFDNKNQWFSTHDLPIDDKNVETPQMFQWIMRYSYHGIPYAVKYPEPDDITPDQLTWIKNYIGEIEKAIYAPYSIGYPLKEYENYIDLQSFVDYWLVFEMMDSRELANPGSVFMHMEVGGKMKAGPLWDFDWGSLSYFANPEAKGNLFCTQAIWYSRLCQDPDFRAMAKSRWAELRPKFLAIGDNFDKYEKSLAKSAKLNFMMWDPRLDVFVNGGFFINGDEGLTFTAAVARAKAIYLDRIQTIDTCLSLW